MIAQFSAIFSGWSGNRDRGSNIIIGLLVVAIVMPSAAKMTSGNPEALAGAHPLRVAEAASHRFMVNPHRGRAEAHRFSTHRPIEERARRLRSIVPNY